MTKIKDISEKKYREITESLFTPLKFRLDWVQRTKELRPAMQLFIVKNFELNINEYYLLIGIPFEGSYLMSTYLCEQPPTFVISDICHILVNNVQNHRNNSYLINQYLNGSGYKNIEHIVMDIFTQEMAIKMAHYQQTDTAILFNDYSYLIQKSLTTVQTATNSLELNNEVSQSFFFFMLSIEDSIKKLNQEFMFLYFCFFKIAEQTPANRPAWEPSVNTEAWEPSVNTEAWEPSVNTEAWEPLMHDLKRSYFQKIDHHINVIKLTLQSQRDSDETLNAGFSNVEISDIVSLQLDELLKNLELFRKKEIYKSHVKPEVASELVLDPA